MNLKHNWRPTDNLQLIFCRACLDVLWLDRITIILIMQQQTSYPQKKKEKAFAYLSVNYSNVKETGEGQIEKHMPTYL